ncbi:IS66 family insertion sequence hypothetical protein [Escherichia sp. E1130]|nr:IS66 family insertion sequence hypothetical protein [Escherichia sp. E1130]TLI62911.1 transposase [Escherichia sp. E1130]
MENTANWRTESRTVYSNDFKLRIVELASQPGANVAKIARENGVAHNLIFKWQRMWQNEGRISRRQPATTAPPPGPSLLPVETCSSSNCIARPVDRWRPDLFVVRSFSAAISSQ